VIRCPEGIEPVVGDCIEECASHAAQHQHKVTADDFGACRGLMLPQLRKAEGIAIRDIFREQFGG